MLKKSWLTSQVKNKIEKECNLVCCQAFMNELLNKVLDLSYDNIQCKHINK